MSEDEIEQLKKHIDYLLDGREYPSDKDKMVSVSKYFRYLSECIASSEILINCDKELLINFEAVYLWLQEQLVYLPLHLKEQIDAINEKSKLCELFAILSSLSDEEINSINRRRRLNASLGIFANILSKRSYTELEESQLVSGTHLVEAKIALTRLSQVTKFASTKVDDDFFIDEDLEDFSERYDPNIINKPKIIALVNLLKSQLNEVEENADIKLILEKIDVIEKEITKRKPRWGVVFSILFLVFGFTADLKTLNPAIYTKPLQTVEAILFSLHEEGQVKKNTSYNLPHHPKEKESNDNKYALFRKKDLEDDVPFDL